MSRITESILNTISIESNSIKNLSTELNFDIVTEIVNLLAKTKNTGKKIIITGCGTSGAAAKKIVHSLTCIEITAVYLNPADAVNGSLGVINQEDIVIIISKGGNTKELTCLIDSLKKKQVHLIYVGENLNSILANNADTILKIKVDKEPDTFNMLATASTLAVIAVFDAICISLMIETNYTKKEFAIIHPSGAVGDRLLDKIR